MKFITREIEQKIVKWIDNKEIIVIRGTRQCGKTTMLNRISEILKENKTNPKKIHVISLEDDFEKDKFEKNPKEYINLSLKEDSDRDYFLLDEIQYVKNAGKIMKLLFDTYDEKVKFIVTGSSTLDLNEMGGFLVGRALFFEMYPFSFEEFLIAKEDEKILKYYQRNKVNISSPKLPDLLFLEQLNEYLKEYLTFGGYPAVVLEKDKEKKKFMLKNLFLTYIEKDIVKIYGIKYKQKIMDLIKYLASINTGIINFEDAGNTTNLYFKEVKDILSIFEGTYIISLIKPFHKNLVTELKKNPKIFFMDLGLRNFISGRFEFSDEEFGKLLENYVLNSLREEKINYWRTTAKAEVDFILNEKTIPIEVKTTYKITRSLRSFISEYNPKVALIINLAGSLKSKINNTPIFIIPASLI